ncbi:MAG: hypothetical protein KJI69_04365 [Patescibacteria group bacterium]|nr:hypothetical protein [Patescibacteria group bacterium]
MTRGFKDQSGSFHPTNRNNAGQSSREKSVEPEGMKMKHGVCEAFLENPPSHRGDDKEHTNQVMYSLGDENCASVLTDEEFSMLLTDDQVANTFSPIGETAKKWEEDEKFRAKIIDRTQELIKEKEKNG